MFLEQKKTTKESVGASVYQGSQKQPKQWPEREKLKDLIEKKNRDKPVELSVAYIDSIITEKELGRGFFGVVYLGRDNELKNEFAVKQIHQQLLRQGHTVDVKIARETFHNELNTLLEFNHPNIACLYGYHLSKDLRGHQYLVFELAEKGSLDHFWENELGRERLASPKVRVQVALDVATALNYLHKGGDTTDGAVCYHRDIKSANICVMRDLRAKLIDAGLAKLVPKEADVKASSAIVGQEGYRDPQYEGGTLKKVGYQEKCDVFSFGVVMTEILTGRLQNHENDEGETVNFYEKYTLDGDPIKNDIDKALDYNGGEDKKCLHDFAELAHECMRRKLDKRPSSDEVVERLQGVSNRLNSISVVGGNKMKDPIINLTASVQNRTCRSCKTENVECLSCKGTQRHYHCKTCMSNHVSSCAGQAEIKCIFVGCDSPLFVDSDLIGFVLQDSWSLFSLNRSILETREELTKQLRRHHMEQMRMHHKTHSKLDESLCMLTNVSAGVTFRCPRLFLLVEAELLNGFQHPRSWLRSKVRKKLHLYFVCGHTHEVVDPPIKISVSRDWVDAIAPALALSLNLLKIAGQVYGFEVPFGPDQIQAMDDALKPALTEDDRNLLQRARDGTLTKQDAQELDGSAFELVAEKAADNMGWHDQVVPVQKDGSIMWVKKQYQSHYS